MANATDKTDESIIHDESRLTGLKKHSVEINKLVTESLQGALLKLLKTDDYEKITVTELCRKAGVSRMAFYGNFKSKDDILKRIVDGLHKELLGVTGTAFRSSTTRQWYEQLFAFVRAKSEVVRLIIGAGFRTKYLGILNESVLLSLGEDSDKKYQRLIWIGGVENAVAHWLETGMTESEKDMADYCCRNLVPWSFYD